jgi:hypothetical protein
VYKLYTPVNAVPNGHGVGQNSVHRRSQNRRSCSSDLRENAATRGGKRSELYFSARSRGYQANPTQPVTNGPLLRRRRGPRESGMSPISITHVTRHAVRREPGHLSGPDTDGCALRARVASDPRGRRYRTRLLRRVYPVVISQPVWASTGLPRRCPAWSPARMRGTTSRGRSPTKAQAMSSRCAAFSAAVGRSACPLSLPLCLSVSRFAHMQLFSSGY